MFSKLFFINSSAKAWAYFLWNIFFNLVRGFSAWISRVKERSMIFLFLMIISLIWDLLVHLNAIPPFDMVAPLQIRKCRSSHAASMVHLQIQRISISAKKGHNPSKILFSFILWISGWVSTHLSYIFIIGYGKIFRLAHIVPVKPCGYILMKGNGT